MLAAANISKHSAERNSKGSDKIGLLRKEDVAMILDI